MNGKLPGTFSSSCHRRISPSSSNLGSATFGTFVPDSDVVYGRVFVPYDHRFGADYRVPEKLAQNKHVRFGGRVSFGWKSNDFNDDGYIGDPTAATPELGKQLGRSGKEYVRTHFLMPRLLRAGVRVRAFH